MSDGARCHYCRKSQCVCPDNDLLTGTADDQLPRAFVDAAARLTERNTSAASMIREAPIKPYLVEIAELRKRRDELFEANNAELEKRRAAEGELAAMTRRLDRFVKSQGFTTWDVKGLDTVLDRWEAAKKEHG